MTKKCYKIEFGEYIDEENYFRCNNKESEKYKELCPYQDDEEMDKCIFYLKKER